MYFSIRHRHQIPFNHLHFIRLFCLLVHLVHFVDCIEKFHLFHQVRQFYVDSTILTICRFRGSKQWNTYIVYDTTTESLFRQKVRSCFGRDPKRNILEILEFFSSIQSTPTQVCLKYHYQRKIYGREIGSCYLAELLFRVGFPSKVCCFGRSFVASAEVSLFRQNQKIARFGEPSFRFLK